MMSTYTKPLVLVGIMGSGKTSAGRALAQRLELDFIDSDEEITRLTGLSAHDIFAEQGEAAFRRYEREIMAQHLSGKPLVLASGGGGFIQASIRNDIKSKAISIWLNSNIHTLLERISDPASRPLLKGGAPAERLQELIDIRYPVYAEADITIVTDGQRLQDTARDIQREIDRFLKH